MLLPSLHHWLGMHVPVHLIHLVQFLALVVIQRVVQLLKAWLAGHIVEEIDEVLLCLVISLTRAPT